MRIEIDEVFKSLIIILFNYPGTFFTNNSYTNLSFENLIFFLFYLIIFLHFYFIKYKKVKIKNLKLFYFSFICLITILFSKLLELYNIPFYANGISVAQTQIVVLTFFNTNCLFSKLFFSNLIKN